MNERVTVTKKDHIATVVLNRPEKMNALDQAGFEQLAAAAASIGKDSQIRAVLIRGAGEHFCSGADKSFLQGAVSDPCVFSQKALNLANGESANTFQKPAISWLELDVPVIVCLQGVVYGAGLQVALAGDIRIGDESTSMSLFEIHWGLIPDMGVSQTLPRLVRADVAAELVFTGRVVQAKEALNIGLLTRLEADPLSAAIDLTKQIASKSPDAIRRGKRLLRDSARLNSDQALALEARLQSELVGTPNQMEAAMANLQKREPQFI